MQVEKLQQLLDNLIQLDSCARIVCSIGESSSNSTLEQPLYYLATRLNRMDDFISCSVACHANSPVAVLEKFQRLLEEHNAAGGTFSYDRRVLTVNNDFSQICFKK